jgi:hypothetical protein
VARYGCPTGIAPHAMTRWAGRPGITPSARASRAASRRRGGRRSGARCRERRPATCRRSSSTPSSVIVIARLDPAADVLGLAGRRAVDARARRRRDRQRRLDVGARRHRHDADERLLGGPGRPARADQEPRDRAGGGQHPRQHGGVGVRRDARLRALHVAGGGAGGARVGRRLPPARPPRAAGRRGRGRGVPRRRRGTLDHRHDAPDRRRRARRPRPRGPCRGRRGSLASSVQPQFARPTAGAAH